MKRILALSLVLVMVIGLFSISFAQELNIKTDAVPRTKVFVSPHWIASVISGNQEESKNYVILNVGWGEVEQNPEYKQGHIPGAIHMNTDYIESEEFWNIRTPEEIMELMKKYGITKDTTVITYSSKPFVSADDRVAFALIWAGVENVKSLDGGLEAWLQAGYPLEKGENKPVPTDKDFGVQIPAHPEFILDIKEVSEKIKNDSNFKLVSIRSYDEFKGETSGYGYIDRAGEPKGAIWGRDTDDGTYFTKDKRVVGIDVVEGFLKESGASFENEVSFYCGTGWRAAIPFLIAYENGIKNISMYDGGWYQWQMDGELDVQLGDPKMGFVKYVKVKDLSTDKKK